MGKGGDMAPRTTSQAAIRIRSLLAVLMTVAMAFALAPGARAGSPKPLAPKVKPSVAPGRAVPLSPRLGVTVAPDETTRLGFCGGDDWEPEIASDSLGYVYVVWAHFPGDPTCDPASANPTR